MVNLKLTHKSNSLPLELILLLDAELTLSVGFPGVTW